MPTGFALGSKVLPPFKPPRPADEDAQALRDALEKILPHAAKNQVSIFLEPINRYEIHYLNTLAEANEIVSALDNPWLKVMADTFHMSIEEANLAQSLTLAASRLGHVHLADSNRRLPGQGHLDFVPIFRTLRKTGYQGWLAIECDRPADPVRELPAAFQYLQECWERAKE
jgi:sugar phosphate isomerase/epimerase